MNSATAQQLLGDLTYQASVRQAATAAAIAHATDTNDQRRGLAQQILRDPNGGFSLFGYNILVFLDTDIQPADADLASAVSALWDGIAGVIPVETLSTEQALAALAADPAFQASVYQIIAAKANGVLALEAATPGSQNAIAWAFAVRLQAGLYLTPAFKQNFAVNVLAAIGDVANVNDSTLSTTIDQLLGLFVAGRVKLIADGKSLANVLDG